MSSFDLGNALKTQTALNLQTLSSGKTNGLAIDTSGYEGVVVALSMHALLNGAPQLDLSFFVSDDSNISNATALNTQFVTKDPGALNTANTTVHYGVVTGESRYLFPEVTSGVGNSTASIVAVLGYPARVPVS